MDVDARIIERWVAARETPDVLRSTLAWQPTGATRALTVDVAALFERIWTTLRRAAVR